MHNNVDLLIRLLLAHFISDFLLQPKSWIEDKNKNKIKSKYLYLHIIVTGVVVVLALGDYKLFWEVVPVIVISHWLIDIGKLYLSRQKTSGFLLDQFLHISVISGVFFYAAYPDGGSKVLDSLISNYYSTKTLLIILGYVLVSFPASVFISIFVKRWDLSSIFHSDSNLKDAGKIIGIIERLLILTFVLFHNYEAIGFLIAAKSVFRFGELHNSGERKLTEYILVGTLLSFAIAIICGILVVYLINSY
jgi:hypothetical protein